jgi:hypothetical protein
MPSTHSPNLRLELIASGEQGNTWGNTTNINLGTLLEKAITGRLLINSGFVGNAYTLSTRNGADDEARNAFIAIGSGVTLSAQGTLTIPAVPKIYIISNGSSGGYAINVKTAGGAGTLIPNGFTKTVMCDGTNVGQATTSADYFNLENTPSAAAHAARKDYVDTKDATKLSLDGSLNMTGNLTLAGNPSTNLHATPKQYVDTNFLTKTSGSTQAMAGMFTLPRDPVGGDNALIVSTRNYVDGSVSGTQSWVNSNFVPKTRQLIAGSGISLNGASGVGVALTGDITIAASGVAGVASLAVVAPVQNTGTGQNPIIGMPAANGGQDGYITAGAYAAFNAKATVSDIYSVVGSYLPLSGGTLSGNLIANGTNGVTGKQFILADSSQSTTRKLFVGYIANGPVVTSFSTNSSYSGLIIGQQWNNGANSASRIAIDSNGDIVFYPNSSTTTVGNSTITGSKTFGIPHPIKPKTKLYHSAIEAPRCDLIYRGVVTLVKGRAVVNIDAASHMSSGTFEALTQNAEVANLHNQDSFWRVRSTPIGNGEFTIIAENPSCEDSITWMVMAERADPDIIKDFTTDTEGRLVPEHPEV